MSEWQTIPSDGNIDHNDCVLVRKRKPDGKWSVDIAYKAINGTWRAGNGAYSIDEARFGQWCPIPS